MTSHVKVATAAFMVFCANGTKKSQNRWPIKNGGPIEATERLNRGLPGGRVRGGLRTGTYTDGERLSHYETARPVLRQRCPEKCGHYYMRERAEKRRFAAGCGTAHIGTESAGPQAGTPLAYQHPVL